MTFLNEVLYFVLAFLKIEVKVTQFLTRLYGQGSYVTLRFNIVKRPAALSIFELFSPTICSRNF